MVVRLSTISILFFVTLALFATQAHQLAHTNAAPPRESGHPEQTTLSLDPQAGGVHLSTTDSGYYSPITKAAASFTHALLRTEIADAVGHESADNILYPNEHTNGVKTELRISANGQTWSDWLSTTPDNDLWQPEDGDNVSWSEILYVGKDMRYWQVRVLADANGTLPDIQRIDVHTVDATFGTRDPRPAFDEHTAPLAGSPAAVDKPAVVSRTAWGCPDGQSSRATPDYRYATHLIIHHTAGSNTPPAGNERWADRVRAIWSFHTYTRGWGDIGYNYLIAPDGSIYEGRAGGDNAVGFHDTANYGSMGVSLMGTYESVSPSAAMQESLVSLLAWKASQNDIDPTGSAAYYGCGISRYCVPYTPNTVLNTISGHRDVTPNYTSCPGQRIVDLLPTIRELVKQQVLNGGKQEPKPDNGDLHIDEVETSFTRSNAQWYQAPCGDGGHTFYTYATDTQDDSTNTATWKLTTPITGSYRVYAHIPQGCGLASPPYATLQAHYKIQSAEGSTESRIDHNTDEEWVNLGTYRFANDKEASVTLDDLTGEPYSQRRIIFFDAIKWVAETEPAPSGTIELLDVKVEPTTIAAGELVNVTFTLHNGSDQTLSTQNPQAALLQDGRYNPDDGYVFHEQECILGDANQTYPTYPKEHKRFRLTLGPTNRTVACAGDHGGYPWRWGLNGDLQPGETRIVTGYVQFTEPGQVTLQAGLVEEYVKYHVKGIESTTITITDEKQAPSVSSFDSSLQPLAQVYRLNDVPDNLLTRARTPFLPLRGAYVGSFVWDGSKQEWGESGPLNISDHVLIEQTRVYMVPVAGAYTFRVTSKGNAWLWIDGTNVITNANLSTHSDEIDRYYTATVQLVAGHHALSFKYYQLSDTATAEYVVQKPGATSFEPLADGLSMQKPANGSTFVVTPVLTLAADDHGTGTLAEIRYSWDGSNWISPSQSGKTASTPGLVHIGPLADGTYHLRYQARDNAGNTSGTQELVFNVNAVPEATPTPIPTVSPTASPTLTVTASPTVSPTLTVTALPTVSPTLTVTASPTVSPTPTPTGDASPVPPDRTHALFLPLVQR